jgi:hypothetical protein
MVVRVHSLSSRRSSSGDARICGGRTEISWVSVSGSRTGVMTNDGSS